MTEILYLSGSLRAGSSSTAVINTICDRLGDKAVAQRFDIGSLPHYNDDIAMPTEVDALKGLVAKADGVIIVTPEYNYSVPGVLKNALDWCSRPALNSCFKGKSVFVASVSAGALGGVRAQAHLKYILGGMLAEVFVWPEVVVPKAKEKTKDGALIDKVTETFLMDGVSAFLAEI